MGKSYFQQLLPILILRLFFYNWNYFTSALEFEKLVKKKKKNSETQKNVCIYKKNRIEISLFFIYPKLREYCYFMLFNFTIDFANWILSKINQLLYGSKIKQSGIQNFSKFQKYVHCTKNPPVFIRLKKMFKSCFYLIWNMRYYFSLWFVFKIYFWT